MVFDMEKNKDTLRNALDQLPSYPAPNEIWEQLEAELDREQTEQPLQVALRGLPSYDPPNMVWDKIEANLPQTGRTSTLRPIYRWLGVAAAIAALVLFSRPFFNEPSSTSIAYQTSISYSTEVVDAQLLDRNWEDDESAFQEVDRLCKQHPFLCNIQDITDMRSELDELSNAKEALQTALGDYGTDQYLLKQMTKIELERTQLLKKLLNRMI